VLEPSVLEAARSYGLSCGDEWHDAYEGTVWHHARQLAASQPDLWRSMVAARASRRGHLPCPRRRARHASTADQASEREKRGTHDGSWSHTTAHTRLSSSRESLGAPSSLRCSTQAALAVAHFAAFCGGGLLLRPQLA